MGVRDAFDLSRELLTPRDMTQAPDGFPEIMLVTFQQKTQDYFRTRFPWEPAGEIRCSFPQPVFSFDPGGGRLGFMVVPPGGPTAVSTAEKAAAMGTKAFVFFGPCGILENALEPDALFVPEEAYRDEGTSYHYQPPSDYLPVPGAEETVTCLTAAGVPFARGRIWTTDALFRETERAAAARTGEGCLAVDMECASLSAFCAFRHYPCRYFLFSADSVSRSAWKRNRLGDTPEAVYETVFGAAIRLAENLRGEII